MSCSPVSYTHLDVYKRQVYGLTVVGGAAPHIGGVVDGSAGVVAVWPTAASVGVSGRGLGRSDRGLDGFGEGLAADESLDQHSDPGWHSQKPNRHGTRVTTGTEYHSF